MMSEATFKDKGYRLKSAMRMRAEGKAAIVRWLGLRPMVVEEQERVDLRQAGPRDGPARHQILDIVTHCPVKGDELPGAHAGIPGTSGSGPAGTMPFGLIRSWLS